MFKENTDHLCLDGFKERLFYVFKCNIYHIYQKKQKVYKILLAVSRVILTAILGYDLVLLVRTGMKDILPVEVLIYLLCLPQTLPRREPSTWEKNSIYPFLHIHRYTTLKLSLR